MAPVVSFRDLEVWQMAMRLAESIYNASQALPRHELYGLTGQMRRAAVSIAANVAEGHGRRSDSVFLNHVRIALGSQAELLTEVELAGRLDYLHADVLTTLIGEIDQTRQLLHGLRRSLERALARRRVGAIATATVIVIASARVFS